MQGAFPCRGADAPKTYPAKASANTFTPYYWYKQPWTGSNQPYIDQEKLIQNELKQGHSIKQIIADRQHAYELKPQSAIAAYTWGYAVYQTVDAPENDLRGKIAPSEQKALDALASTNDCRSYLFVRLRFLISAYSFQQCPPRLGDRLLAFNSKDADVIRAMLNILPLGSNPSYTKLGLEYAQRLKIIKPSDRMTYLYLALTYHQIYDGNKTAANKLAAAKAWREFLAHAPDNDALKIRMLTHPKETIELQN